VRRCLYSPYYATGSSSATGGIAETAASGGGSRASSTPQQIATPACARCNSSSLATPACARCNPSSLAAHPHVAQPIRHCTAPVIAGTSIEESLAWQIPVLPSLSQSSSVSPTHTQSLLQVQSAAHRPPKAPQATAHAQQAMPTQHMPAQGTQQALHREATLSTSISKVGCQARWTAST